jgi:hypothetical protein
MDISTGHMILVGWPLMVWEHTCTQAYMEEHLANKDKLSEDWAAVAQYLPDRVDTHTARLPLNAALNRDMDVLPCTPCVQTPPFTACR